MTTHPSYIKASFLTSAAKLNQAPPDEGIEVAFAGRSNSGKSSAINLITNTKGLAKTSKTPGRTQLINFFEIDEERRFVDLPGYGYAKVPAEIKRRWEHSLEQYLETRQCLKGLILLMDIRHPLKDTDRQLIEWAHQSQLPIHILLTKADKLKRGPINNTLQQVMKELSLYGDTVSTQTFSALKRQGVDQALTVLSKWLDL